MVSLKILFLCWLQGRRPDLSQQRVGVDERKLAEEDVRPGQGHGGQGCQLQGRDGQKGKLVLFSCSHFFHEWSCRLLNRPNAVVFVSLCLAIFVSGSVA